MDQVGGRTQPEKQWRDRLAWLAEPAPLAVLTALACLATFPPANAAPLAWVCFAPLAARLNARGLSPGRALAAGWIFGIVYWGGQFSWLVYTFVFQGGVSPVATLVFCLVFGTVLALVPAGAFMAAAAVGRIGLAPGLILPLVFGAADRLLGEWPFGGLGWGSLAAPQAGTFAAAWILPVLGGPGLVAALVGVNSLWAAVTERLRTRPSRRVWLAAAGLALATLALQWPIGGGPWGDPAGRDVGGTEAPGTIGALLVPGQLTLRELHAGEGTAASLRYFLARTLATLTFARSGETGASAAKPGETARAGSAPGQPLHTLVVWPESAVMEPLNRGHALVDLSAAGALADADFLVGSDVDEPGRLANALFLVTGGRFDFTRYDKRHLVPFGEFVPAEFRWAFGRKVTTGDRDYTPGIQAPAVVWRSPAEGGATLGLAICFESILPRHALDAVQAGAEVLVVAANDAWLPRYAVDQHILLSALRGREVGRDVLFVSNGGPALRIVAGQVRARSESAPLAVNAVRRTGQTPWVRWGDWSLAGAAAAIVGLGLMWRGVRKRRGAA